MRIPRPGVHTRPLHTHTQVTHSRIPRPGLHVRYILKLHTADHATSPDLSHTPARSLSSDSWTLGVSAPHATSPTRAYTLPTPCTCPTAPGCAPGLRASRPWPRPGVRRTPGITAAAAAPGAPITVIPGVGTTLHRARDTEYLTSSPPKWACARQGSSASSASWCRARARCAAARATDHASL